VGTDPASDCAATPARNDEPPPDAWPVDFDNNQYVNGSDILTFALVFGKHPGDQGYNARFDLNNDNTINGTDFLKMAPFFGKRCTQQLTLTVMCIPSTDPGTFSLQIDGVSTGANVACQHFTVVDVSIGAHTVSETADPNYTTVIGGNCTITGAVTLAFDDGKSCTITNTHH
jgi:hypothetical protein